MRRSFRCGWGPLFAIGCCLLGWAGLATGDAMPASAAEQGLVVRESARQIPIAYEVDVVVVGGSTGAVAAAVAAAQEGAKVFLAAPYPYLGEDMTGTLRLWLEEQEEPTTELARRIFLQDPHVPEQLGRPRLQFRYTADRPSARLHPDTKPPSLLTDGQWGSAVNQSVQYDGDVTITADLGQPMEVDVVRLIAYLRKSSPKPEQNFAVAKVLLSVSNDGQSWTEAGQLLAPPPVAEGDDQPVAFTGRIGQKARYVRLEVKKEENVGRILLGEVELFGPPEPASVGQTKVRRIARPLHVKKTLDEALLAAKVPFLYSCYPTDVLVDGEGRLCGIVMANRAGRQAVVARAVIDATPRALIARLAGAKFAPYPAGLHTFQRVVIGGQPVTGQNMQHRLIGQGVWDLQPNPAEGSGGRWPMIEYTLQLPMPDDSFASWAQAEQLARSMTYHPDQQLTADLLFQVPPDRVESEADAQTDSSQPNTSTQSVAVGPSASAKTSGSQPGASAGAAPSDSRVNSHAASGAQIVDSLAAFRPKGKPELWILGGCAGVSRQEAARILRPARLMELGEQIGRAAARQALKTPAPKKLQVYGGSLAVDRSAVPLAAAGDVREELRGIRPGLFDPKQGRMVPQPDRLLPVLGQYDVVVIGGGTAGAPAAIAAARARVKTIVCEQLHMLGGVGTAGYITNYYWGNRVGFTATVPTESKSGRWLPERRAEWWRTEILKAGGHIWMGVIGCGAFVQDKRVCGAVVATPEGRGVLLANVVIDATGNSDVAAAAGAECLYTDSSELAMQGTGLPPRRLGASYTNTDFTIADETDMMDIWHLLVYAKDKYPQAFDQGQLVDTRERRRIRGDFVMTLLDQVLDRTYPDTICIAYSNFDTHGYTVDPYLELEHPEHKGFRVRIPYRCMLPKGLEGILVIGLGLSAHRDAVPLIRMQADIQNTGYAAGRAAAMAVQAAVPLRQIDIRQLQKHLVEIGNLPETVLEEKDNFPLPPERIAQAVETVKDNFRGVAVLLAHPQQALPLLQKAYHQAQKHEEKLIYARILAVLGDNTGLDTLIAEVRKYPAWDQGWDYRGMGQFGSALSPLDQLIIALGRTRDPRAVPAILEKAKLLTAKDAFSHHRAVALALELIGDRRAAPVLAALLTQPDMSGYVHETVEDARRLDQKSPGGTNAVQTRRDSLRELHLARALYRCGDYGGVGRAILERYTRDLRGHLARHAKAVLEEGPRPAPPPPSPP
ncbi:MAG: FAD-dependent oxidoreductase [Thermoguttaceae bacterium]|nr:FAD-dependent oxidoreductase [Thermoguttaceae bacterium]